MKEGLISGGVTLFAFIVGMFLGQPAPDRDEAPPKPEVVVNMVHVPSVGLTMPCKILSVHDGDTLKVECKIVMDVRLLDCWAPELHGEDRLKGMKSRDNLKLIADGKSGIVYVPLTSDNIGKATSMSRILGRVYIGGDDLSYEQTRKGFATKTKEVPEK